MATTKNITMKQFNGNDYDTLYPQTQGSQIIGSVPIVSGGTGGINATSGMYNLLNGMSTIAPATNDLFPFKDVSGSTSGLVTLTNLITAMGNNGVITTSNLSTQASNLGFSKIQTGSYVGTGTYGPSNPCSLTFNYTPRILWIYAFIRTDHNKYMTLADPFPFLFDWASTTYKNNIGPAASTAKGMYSYVKCSDDRRTIYWYNTKQDSNASTAVYQLNYKDAIYYWLTIE